MNRSLERIIENLCDFLSMQGYSKRRINEFKTVAKGLDGFLEEKRITINRRIEAIGEELKTIDLKLANLEAERKALTK